VKDGEPLALRVFCNHLKLFEIHRPHPSRYVGRTVMQIWLGSGFLGPGFPSLNRNTSFISSSSKKFSKLEIELFLHSRFPVEKVFFSWHEAIYSGVFNVISQGRVSGKYS
jgi:hypothetical protein